MNKQLTTNLAIVAAASIALYVAIVYVLPNNGVNLGPLQQQYAVVAAGGAAAAGLLIVRHLYLKQNEKQTQPSPETPPFNWSEYEKSTVKKTDAPMGENENPLSRLYNEIETGKTQPQKADPPSTEELLNRKILQAIAGANIKVTLNAKIQDGKWKIDSGETTISMDRTPAAEPKSTEVRKREG